MRILVIDDQLKESVANLVAYAEAHVFSLDELLDMQNGEQKPAGEVEPHVLVLETGYRIVYSIEEQVKGRMRHLSVSVDQPGKLPSIEAVNELMGLIGFDSSLEECLVYMEDIGPNHQAVNIMEDFK